MARKEGESGGGSRPDPPAMVRSAGVVVVRETPPGVRYLLLRAFRYWDFPKGRVEVGEAPFDAARREVAEETGIVALEHPWGRVWVETPPYGRGKVARYYLGRVHSARVVLPVSPELGRPEHHEYRWLDYEGASALLVARVREVLAWARGVVEDRR